MLNTIKQLKDSAQKLMDSGQIIAISYYRDGLELHTRSVDFIDCMAKANQSKVVIGKRGDGDFPFEIYTKVNNVKIFKLMTSGDVLEYARSNVIGKEALEELMNENCPSDVGASAEAGDEAVCFYVNLII